MARKIGSRYTAHQILGRGSAGTVWLGEGPEGPVAIKLLREDLASDEELVGRFVQERTALLGLDHPNVVSVRDLVVDGNDLALVMDLVRGTDLRTRLDRDRRLAPEAAVAITADVAEGLAAAHAAGVVHRDVKPENVLLDMQGPLGPGGSHRALLTDFGVAKLIDTPKRTRATKIIGTPDYLAPEIVEGLPPRAAVDIYALATVLYELLAGFTPFGGGHPGAVLRRHVTESVAPLPGIPDELWQLIVQCLAKAPASRLRASELAARLREQLPTLTGMPPLDVDEPDTETDDEPEAAPAPGAPGAPAAEPAARARRGAVPLVPGAKPDSNRDTHTSMRVPAPDELAGGAHGTARVPRAAGAPRPGSARNRATTRRRRLVLAAAAVVLLAAAGVGTWLATSGDDADASPSKPPSSAGSAPSAP
ncbi:serine/threonine-protein kinase [Streptomyces longwoodensis]|uniref:non-specific serine/threonine protein kinase n=1 Tax=Streptomyces lasalocidi TaxID=324833 RepID=A0A4U5WGQ7_STRLS|nr:MULTISPECIES: serine/threonine-protein kinase [Streptomyces]MCX4994018.1 serine/threonine protein kinase [Streptomyces longwoodensis]TKT01079.1 serine/threonine protein kinase [Streptomyces lasalocidi]WRY88958.1 serine/threonine protein kinase [Streptomyces longwoodensis]WTI46783.1 serine/threonine protein kinase [Streptomyces longwoodensis]WUC59558.1 serine/threonine protein kinase [Streptomyces longwoodensis]